VPPHDLNIPLGTGEDPIQ